jgi:hypothetical protein
MTKTGANASRFSEPSFFVRVVICMLSTAQDRDIFQGMVRPAVESMAPNGVHDSYVAAAGNLWRILALSLFGSTRIFGGLGAL